MPRFRGRTCAFAGSFDVCGQFFEVVEPAGFWCGDAKNQASSEAVSDAGTSCGLIHVLIESVLLQVGSTNAVFPYHCDKRL